MLAMRYAEKLHTLCEAKGWDQADLWRAIGGKVSRSTVSNWWNDATRPDMDTALLVARALGVSLDVLADDAAGLDQAGPEADYEAKVCEIAGRLGWEWLYWRVIEAEKVVGRAGPELGRGGGVADADGDQQRGRRSGSA